MDVVEQRIVTEVSKCRQSPTVATFSSDANLKLPVADPMMTRRLVSKQRVFPFDPALPHRSVSSLQTLTGQKMKSCHSIGLNGLLLGWMLELSTAPQDRVCGG